MIIENYVSSDTLEKWILYLVEDYEISKEEAIKISDFMVKDKIVCPICKLRLPALMIVEDNIFTITDHLFATHLMFTEEPEKLAEISESFLIRINPFYYIQLLKI